MLMLWSAGYGLAPATRAGHPATSRAQPACDAAVSDAGWYAESKGPSSPATAVLDAHAAPERSATADSASPHRNSQLMPLRPEREHEAGHGAERHGDARGDDPRPDSDVVRHERNGVDDAGDDRRHHHDRHHRRLLAEAPGEREPHAAQRRHRRGEAGQVVRVERLGPGERGRSQEQPKAPQHGGGAPGVGAGFPSPGHEDGDERGQGGEHQPGDVVAVDIAVQLLGGPAAGRGARGCARVCRAVVVAEGAATAGAGGGVQPGWSSASPVARSNPL